MDPEDTGSGGTATEVVDRPKPADVRSKLMEAGDKLRELREKKPEERGDTYTNDVREATKTIHELDAILTAYERGSEPEKVRSASRGPGAAMADVGDDIDLRSAGAQFVESEQWLNRSEGKVEAAEVRALISTEQNDPGGGLFMPRGNPLPPQERRQRLFARDLLSVVETTLNSVPYIRELNAATNEGGATAVAEGTAKPEVTMQFSLQDAPIRKIAAWVPITTEVVDDAPTLRGYIDTRLGYMLALREEAQILNGNGTSPNLRGIRQTTGLQTQAAVTGDFAATLGRAIGKVEAVDGDADGIALNPTDFWTMVTTRFANQFDGGMGGSFPYGAAPTTLWGLRTVRTRSMEAGKALVGSWRLGATIFDRQETTIRTSDSHANYFIENKMVILAEERIGLAVHRPDFFVEVTLA